MLGSDGEEIRVSVLGALIWRCDANTGCNNKESVYAKTSAVRRNCCNRIIKGRPFYNAITTVGEIKPVPRNLPGRLGSHNR